MIALHRPEESPMSLTQQAGTEVTNADAVTVLATALDRLGARIHRDLHVDSSHIDLSDPRLADTLTGFSAYADECLAALDNPAVTRVLAAARADRRR
jgi:metal-dependent HD superfamily phosphatase/phosphodiesterase